MKNIVYEIPANELIRACLCLEQLFNQIKQWKANDSTISFARICQDIIEIVNILDRTDIKNLLSKELQRQTEQLTTLRHHPQIDHKKLDKTLEEITYLNDLLTKAPHKLAQNIREDDFLNSIKIYTGNPGGIRNFDNANYFYWLNHPEQKLKQRIEDWLQELADIKRIIVITLHLIRESALPKQYTATQGLCQINLDPKINCQLIRLFMNATLPAYPEVSVGKHRIAVRFMQPTLQGKPKPYEQELIFSLSF